MIKLISTILFVFIGTTANARMHEIEIHSTEALVQFSDETTANIEANYLFEIDSTWQVLTGAKYEIINADQSRMGFTVGGVYNFGAADHNEKFYIKPQVNFTYFDNFYGSDSVVFISGVVGKRIPIFKGTNHTLNYTPSVGVSVPVTNTDEYDVVFSVSLIGLSLVF